MLFGEAYQLEDIGVMRDQKLRGLEEEFCDTSLYCVKDRNLIEDACKLKKRVDENNKKKLDNFKDIALDHRLRIFILLYVLRYHIP